MNTFQWWLASLGDNLVWARMEVLEDGVAEVLQGSGERLRYDDEMSARMALLDAEFRAFDGLDAEDAALLGFDLDAMEPPQAESEAELLPRMVHKIAR